ncbi:MAG: ABC transporter ATP-binding protein [Bacteriovoracaceae bacterium]|nr:ABC transporter ATP-binding protein [Bacteriovoracaceae bacterium]
MSNSNPKNKTENKKKTFLKLDDQDENNIDENETPDYKSLLYLLKYSSQFKWKITLSLVLMISTSIIVIASARAMGHLVDQGLIPGDYDKAWVYAGMILTFEVAAVFTGWIGRSLLAKYALASIFEIRKGLFEHVQLLPMTYYDTQPQGRVVTRITHDVESLEQFFTSSLGRLFNALFMTIVASTAMLATDFRLGSILILSMVPAATFVFGTRGMVRKINRKMSRLNSALNAKLSEYINGIEVIRSFGLEKWSKSNYDKAVNEHLGSQLEANMLFSWSRPLVSFLCTLPLIGLVWFGGKSVLTGVIGVGLFVTFVRYCERFFMPIMILAREIHIIQQAFTSAERISNFLREKDEMDYFNGNGELGGDKDFNLQGKIEFKDVFMAYEGENYVLKGLDFEIHSGEKIGLVGTTGCGKTTTVSLISRLYEFQKGEILLDDHNIRYYDREFLRKRVGFVSQDAILFRGSLRNNLTTDELRDEVILEGCEKTGLSNIMNKSGLTLDSLILEGGSNLSIGERQLVALTRVLLRNPAILVLDEATANIDPHFEKIIHTAVDKIMEERTCLMIAHRLDTLDHCDRILVFEKGELVQQGSREELLIKEGHFKNLHQAALRNPDLLK